MPCWRALKELSTNETFGSLVSRIARRYGEGASMSRYWQYAFILLTAMLAACEDSKTIPLDPMLFAVDGLATVNLAGLNSVAFAPDGLRGVAVGEFGIVLETADGGDTWKATGPAVSNGLEVVAAIPKAAEEKIGFVAGGRYGQVRLIGPGIGEIEPIIKPDSGNILDIGFQNIGGKADGQSSTTETPLHGPMEEIRPRSL